MIVDIPSNPYSPAVWDELLAGLDPSDPTFEADKATIEGYRETFAKEARVHAQQLTGTSGPRALLRKWKANSAKPIKK
jgi:hypothetical protein